MTMQTQPSDFSSLLSLSFDFETFNFLFQSKNTSNLLIKYFVSFARPAAICLAAIGLAFEFFKLLTGESPKLFSWMVRVALIVFLIPNYSFLIKEAIKFFDDPKSGIVSNINSFSKNSPMLAMRAFSDTASGNEQKVNQDFKDATNDKLKKPKAAFNPKLSLLNFDIPTFFAVLFLFLCQVAICLVCFIRNAFIAVMILAGYMILPTIASERTQSWFWGWAKSFLNILLWTVWLSLIIAIQSALMGDLFAENTDVGIFKGVVYCLVFLIAYIKIFGLTSELLAGSAFSTIAQMAAFVGVGGAAAGASSLYRKYKGSNFYRNPTNGSGPSGGNNNSLPPASPVPIDPGDSNFVDDNTPSVPYEGSDDGGY